MDHVEIHLSRRFRRYFRKLRLKRAANQLVAEPRVCACCLRAVVKQVLILAQSKTKRDRSVGMLVDGKWQNDDLADFKRDGKTIRFSSDFHPLIRPEGEFPPAANRCALYCN